MKEIRLNFALPRGENILVDKAQWRKQSENDKRRPLRGPQLQAIIVQSGVLTGKHKCQTLIKQRQASEKTCIQNIYPMKAVQSKLSHPQSTGFFRFIFCSQGPRRRSKVKMVAPSRWTCSLKQERKHSHTQKGMKLLRLKARLVRASSLISPAVDALQHQTGINHPPISSLRMARGAEIHKSRWYQ